MLNRALFSLQDNCADRDRARQPLHQRDPRRRISPLGTWGIPLATSLRQHRRHGALLWCRGAGSAASSWRSRALSCASSPRLSPVRRRSLSGRIDSAVGRALWGQLASVLLRSLPLRRLLRGLPGAESARVAGATSCEAFFAGPDNPWTKTHPQLRSSRTSTMASRRSPIASRATHAVSRVTCAQVLDSMTSSGSVITSRRRPSVEWSAINSTDRHTRSCRLHLRGFALASGL